MRNLDLGISGRHATSIPSVLVTEIFFWYKLLRNFSCEYVCFCSTEMFSLKNLTRQLSPRYLSHPPVLSDREFSNDFFSKRLRWREHLECFQKLVCQPSASLNFWKTEKISFKKNRKIAHEMPAFSNSITCASRKPHVPAWKLHVKILTCETAVKYACVGKWNYLQLQAP